MSKNTHFITASRVDLADMSKRLTSALEPNLLSVAKDPVIITVLGANMAGKKIIPDEAIRGLLGSTASMAGVENFDEIHTGLIMGQPAEIIFANLCLSDLLGGYSDRTEKNYRRNNGKYIKQSLEYVMFRSLEDQRKVGGISFLHNTTKRDIPWDIEIFMEPLSEQAVHTIDHQQEDRLRRKDDTISALQAFRATGVETPQTFSFHKPIVWGTPERYVEVTVHSQRLLNSVPFMAVFNKLAAKDSGVIPGYAHSQPDETPWVAGSTRAKNFERSRRGAFLG